MEKNCSYCEEHFTAQRDSRKYCSDNCKQMAYFKRNGLILSGGSEIGNLKYETPIILKTDTVKYAKPIPEVKYETPLVKIKETVKSDSITMDQKMLDAIVNRLNIQMESAIKNAIEKVKQELTVKYESLIVKQNFTVNGIAEETIKKFCIPVSFTGIKGVNLQNPSKINYCNPSESLIAKYSTLKENTVSPITKNEQEHFTLEKIKETELNNAQIENRELEEEQDKQEQIEKEEQEQETQMPEQIELFELPEEQDEEEQEEEEEEEEEQEQEQEKEELQEREEEENKNSLEKEKEQEQEEQPYKWIESKIIKSIEKNYVNSKEHLFKDQSRSWNNALLLNVNWITERFSCLTESLIKLSNYNRIDKHTLLCITDAFNRLINSNAFANLPDNYHYTELIKELCIKLNHLVQKCEYSDQLKFSLSLDLKSRLISTRYEMLESFPATKFCELDFTEEKSFLKKQQERQDEEEQQEEDQDEKITIPKSDWRIRYQALKRQKLREATERTAA